MEPYGTGCYFEDLPVGAKFKTTGRTITEADMIAFCNCTGLTSELFVNAEYQWGRLLLNMACTCEVSLSALPK